MTPIVILSCGLVVCLTWALRCRRTLFRDQQTQLQIMAVGSVSVALAAVSWRMSNDQAGLELPAKNLYAANRPVQVPADGYVSSSECVECHRENHSTWHDSYHSKMTQLATPQAVLGDFDDCKVTTAKDGREYTLFRVGDEFRVRMPDLDDPDGAMIERPIVMTTGSHHMQVYWYPTGTSRVLNQLPIVYLLEDQRWAPRKSAFLMPPEKQHVTTENMRWNKTCLGCHSTHGRPRLASDRKNADTQVAEFGISCEACHGPGEAHIQYHRTGNAAGLEADPVCNPESLSHQTSAQVCGRCHGVHGLRSRRQLPGYLRDGFEYKAGEDLNDSRLLIYHDEATANHLIEAGWRDDEDDVNKYMNELFWSDGMVRVSGREYTGLSRSGCFLRGDMSCVSCHKLHQSQDDPRDVKEWANDQLKPDMRTDHACLQCHEGNDYDTPAHTHHTAESSGSRCVNCHMPYTTFGLLKAIRSHLIDSPDTAATVTTGRPNACNQCHLDRTLKWAGDHLHDWYGIERPELSEEQATIADTALMALRGDAGQRALAAWSMGWQPAIEASGRD